MIQPTPIRDALRAAWERYADRPAVVTSNGTRTYSDLADSVQRLAGLLARLGAEPGRAVGLVVTLDSDILTEVRFATYELGATLFAIPPDLLTDGSQLVQEVDPSVVVYDPKYVPGIPEWLRHICPRAHALPARDSAGAYSGLLDTVPAEPIETSYDPDCLTAVGFTSGTTGPPKGITATNHASSWSCEMMRRVFSSGNGTHEGGVLIGIPLFAAGGGMVAPTLASGGTVYAPGRFDPVEALSLIDRGEVVTAFVTPSMVIDMLDVEDLDRYDLSGLQAVIYGTSIMPTPKLEEAIRRIGPVFLGGYGMAEVLPPVTVLHRHEHGTRAKPAGFETLSSVGIPVEGVRVRIVDAAGSETVSQVGEVEIQSPAVTTGYWGDTDRTAAARHDGWWRSGDIGFMDHKHRLHILSRKADVIWLDGQPIYPRHLEETCSLHPAVKEACAVQAAPNAPVMVAVSLRRSIRPVASDTRIGVEIKGLISEHLADSVSVGDIMVFDEIPRSVQGKVLHREVRGAVTARGGAGAA